MGGMLEGCRAGARCEGIGGGGLWMSRDGAGIVVVVVCVCVGI
jgi:hypothetical protein